MSTRLGLCQTLTIELFLENNQYLKFPSYFRLKVPSWVLEKVLNTYLLYFDEFAVNKKITRKSALESFPHQNSGRLSVTLFCQFHSLLFGYPSRHQQLISECFPSFSLRWLHFFRRPSDQNAWRNQNRMVRKFTKMQSIRTSLCRQVQKKKVILWYYNLVPRAIFKKNIFAFLL